MTIEEAIKHCEEVAHEKRIESGECISVNDLKNAEACYECGKEHKQLALWLTELKQRREAAASYETINLSKVAGCDQFICKECGLHLEDWYRLDGDAWLEECEFKFCPNCGRKVREEGIL